MKVLVEASKKVVPPIVEQTISVTNTPRLCSCNLKSLVYILFGTLSIGLFWQIQAMYLQKLIAPSTLSIETNIDEFHKIPALTFCTNIGDVTNGITSKTFFDLIKVQDIVEYIEVTSSYSEPIRNLSFLMDTAIETISYKYYCFTINSALQGYSAEIKNSQQVWIKLKHLPISIYNSWWIYMHNSYDVPSSYEWNAIEAQEGHYIPITYSHESYQQIESIYNTNCKNYLKKTEFTSRRDCIRKCKLRDSLLNCGVVYNGIDVHKDSEGVTFASDDSQRQCVVDSTKYGDQCMSECDLPDCQQNWYTPILISKYMNNWNYSLIELIPPSKPELTYKHKPLLDSKLSIYFMSGSLSIWVGLAMFWLYNWFCKRSVPKN